MAIEFEVNRQGLKVSGVKKDTGDIVTKEQLGKQWRQLLAGGRIRRVGQSKREAFRDGRRFRL